MVTTENMGSNPVEIVALGYMPSENSQKTGSYNDFSLFLGHTDFDELTMKFDNNWQSTPLEVYSEPHLLLNRVEGGEWLVFEFDDSFMYDGTSNLLFELSWNGPVDPPDSKIYAMTWEDTANHAIVTSVPNGETGYLTTAVPNLLFVTTEDLQASTFGSIKSSF